jgi:leader peptidase (prepilin peptidase)/N-methyltransferase
MEILIAAVAGLLAGSFLNVCIHRWPRDLSVVRPRSHCPHCEKTIAWYDNVPLLSYALLRGRCRHCGERISPRYPVVELITALLFVYFVGTLGATLAAAKMCLFAAILVGLAFSDLEELILPDELTLGGAALGLAIALFVPVPDITAMALGWIAGIEPAPGRWQSLAEAAVGALLPAFALWGGGWLYQKIRHREGLGFGDVKLIAMVGTFLGLRGALLTLAFGSLAGSVIGYAYIKAKGEDPSTYELPFGTFLGVAAVVVAMAAPKLLAVAG